VTHARLRVAAGVMLAVTTLGACGGTAESPKVPSTADFCAAYNSLYTSFTKTDPNDRASVIKALKDWAQRMKDVGKPADIPAAAGRGLELLVNTAAGLDENATDKELNDLSASFTAAQRKDGDAFDSWTGTVCTDPLESPSSSSS
jgi:hypothetical protein